MLVTQTQIVIRVTKLRAVHVCRVSSTSGCSGVAQGLLLLYRHDHVDVNFIIGNTEHDADSTSHGYVEDRRYGTVRHYTSHWRSLMH